MRKRTKPIRVFKFAENSRYMRSDKRHCEIKFDNHDGITFSFTRYNQNYNISMHRDDVDEFLNWYQIEHAFKRRQEKYSSEEKK